MAYTVVSALTRQTRTDPTWTNATLGDISIRVILNSYYALSIALTNPFEEGTRYLDKALLYQQAPATIPSTQTLNEWLASLGNQALITNDTPPPTTPVSVQYADAWQAGYTIERGDIARNPNTQASPASLPDLCITKAGLDMVSMSNYLLVSVNGYLHRTVGTVNGLYAIGGGKTHDISNENYCGVFSFLPIGKMQQIPITPAMVHKPNLQQMYSESAYITVPVSLANKIVLLSLGGYLHVLDGMYEKVSDTTLKINIFNLQLPQRLYQSAKRIDLSSLPISTGLKTSEQWSVSSIYSDAVILNYLTLPQSFLIVIDTPTWYKQTFTLERSCVPGRYFSGLKRRLPLIGPLGRLYEYRLSQEEDTYVYGCEAMHDPQYNFETTRYQDLRSLGPHQYSALPWRPGLGQLLDMGTFQ